MIYHIVKPKYWKNFEHKDLYFSETFEQELFIHCSTNSQIEGVLSRYYKNAKEVFLLHLDESKLIAELKFEKATNEELFPHIYGGINKDSILKIETLVEISEGVYQVFENKK